MSVFVDISNNGTFNGGNNIGGGSGNSNNVTDNLTLETPFVYLFRFRGQSNSLGQGENSELAASYLDAFQNVFIWNNSNTQFENLLLGTNNGGSEITEHGAEAELAQLLETNYPNQDFYILKTGIGGRQLSDMLPTASGDSNSVFVKDRDETIAAVNDLLSQGLFPVIIDLFIQGESDTGTEELAYSYSDKWDTYYTTSLDQVDKNLPIIVAEIGNFTANRIIINDTLAYQSKDKDNVYLIRSGNYPRLSAGDSHFNTEGVKMIGTDLYRLVKNGIVKGAPVFKDLPLEKPSGLPTSAEYQVILDYASGQGYTAPSLSQQALQIQLINDLKNAGAWDNLDAFYVTVTDGDQNFAMINWKNPIASNSMTINGGVTFTADQGIRGNGTDGFLEVPVLIFISNYTQNDAGVIVDIVTPNSIQGAVIGRASQSNGLLLSTNTFGNNVLSRVNSSTNTNVSNGGSGVGFWHWARSSNQDVNLYKDGSLFSNVNHASAAIPGNFDLRIMSNNGAFFDLEIGLFAMGSNNESNVAAINTAWTNYKNAI